MQSFKTYITEADTSSATNEEMAIVYVYNKHQGMSHEDALNQGLMTEKDFTKLNSTMLDIAEDIYLKNLKKGNRGGVFKMAGKKSGPNHYEGASDNTSKADFYGNNKNHISLKQSDDKKGAQLISSKSAEAAGAVNAAILHYENVAGKNIAKDASYKKAINTLENKMLESARSDIVVPIKAGKRDLKDWYLNDSGRLEALKQKLGATYNGKKGEALIIKHMKYELQILNALARSSGYEKNALPEIPKSKRESKTWVTDLSQPSASTLTKFIFPTYVKSETSIDLSGREKKYLPSDMNTPEIRKQITELVGVAVESIEWKKDLSSFFENNEELKSWIVYEAGSGLYKFTKQISDGKDYTGKNWRVANRMLVFRGGKGGGFNKEYVDLIAWSKNNAGLVEQIDISYKGSGKDRYIKFGIPTKLKESIDECIDSELPSLNEELQHIQDYYLEEGFFGGAGKKLASLGSKVTTAFKKFYERVVLRFMSKIRRLAETSVSQFLDVIGLKIQAKLKLGSVT